MRYLLFSLVFLCIWFTIFILNKKLRKEMLTVSILLTPLALTEFMFVPGYWIPDSLFGPRLSIEDFIFCFATSGIAAVIYEIFMRGTLRHYRLKHSFNGQLQHAGILGIGLLLFIACFFLLHIHIIYAAYIATVVDILLIIISRPDLTKKIIFSSILFGVLYIVVFISFSAIIAPGFGAFWNTKNLSGIIFFGMPLEEAVWAFSAGAIGAPIYEYILSWKLEKKRV